MFELQIDRELEATLDKSGAEVRIDEAKRMKNQGSKNIALLGYDNGKMVRAFGYEHKGFTRWIPEPDPILVFINSAWYNLNHLEEEKTKLLDLAASIMDESLINNLYSYFGLVSNYTVTLFAAVEAFLNQAVSGEWKYEKPSEKKTEIYTKDQITLLPIDVKMKEVLPAYTGKDFAKAHPQRNVILGNFKAFRNSIVHLKESKDGLAPYQQIFKSSLQYNFRDAFNDVVEYINFYHAKPNYIHECDCRQTY